MEERRMVIIELPPGMAKGFRFHPTDAELITDYLRPKLLGRDSDVDKVIAEVDFCKFEPWDLPPQSKIESKDRMWLFFGKRDYKYPSSKRSKRTTKEGFWKITGKERVIKDQETKKCIGKKRTLVFHKGPTPGQRTNWVMHEYYIEPHLLPNQRSYVLCRLKEKANDKANTPDSGEGNPCGDITSEVENPVTPAAIPSVQFQVHGHAEGNAESPSQLVSSPDGFLTEVEMSSILEDCLNDDQNTQFVHENHPNPENSLPHQVTQFTEEFPEEIMDRLSADPDADPYTKYYGEAAYNPFIDRIPQASFWRPYNEDGLVRSDTNTEGVNEQSRRAKRGLGLSDSPVGSKKTQILQMAGISSEELQGDIPRERRPRIQPQDRVSSTAASGNMVGYQELQMGLTREPPLMRVQLQAGRVSSTEISGHMVHTEAATNDSISRLDRCIIAVVFCIIAVIVGFGLVVLGICDIVLSQLRRQCNGVKSHGTHVAVMNSLYLYAFISTLLFS